VTVRQPLGALDQACPAATPRDRSACRAARSHGESESAE
jgi:hypothetical protein